MPRPERPLDPAGGPIQEFAAQLRTLRRRAGSPSYRELARRAHFAMATLAHAARGDRLPSLAVTLAYVRACDETEDTEDWARRWRAVAEHTGTATPAEPGGEPPYPGLAAFQAGDADRFFGREELVQRLRLLLGQRRFVAVVGASGAGKSSVLRAGLLPQAGPALVITPGARPLEECAIALGARLGTPAGTLAADLRAQPRNLGLALRQLLHEEHPGAELLLVVDQFEELFTLCSDPAERTAFLAALRAASDDELTGRTRVVIGVRSDFYTHCLQRPELAPVLQDAQIVVGRLSTDELRAAIVEPAVRARATVETALVTRLVADASGRPGVLPLVSHALLETWKRRRGNTLTLTAYDEAGGIEHAVARTAEHVHEQLSEPQRELLRGVLLRLTALGEGTEDTKRRIDRTELDTADPDTALVLDRLTQARLLTRDGDSIEITHEALIRSWPRLRGWLTEDRDGLRVHRALTDAAAAWEADGRDPDALYRGSRLALARDWVRRHPAALSPREQEFLARAVAEADRAERLERRRTTRLRQAVALLAVLVLLSGTAAVLAVRAQEVADRERTTAIAQRVADRAISLRTANPGLAARLSLAAYRLAPTREARGGLYGSFATHYASPLAEQGNTVYDVEYHPDGRAMVIANQDSTVGLWDVADPAHPHRVRTLYGHEGAVLSAVYSPDGTLVASGGQDGVGRLWSVRDPGRAKEIGRFPQTGEQITTLAFSRDGTHLVAGAIDGAMRVWDVHDPAAPRLLSTLREFRTLHSLAFSPDRRTLAAVGTGSAAVRFYDTADPGRPRELAQPRLGRDAAYGGAFNRDGTLFATGLSDRTVQVVDVRERDQPRTLPALRGHEDTVYDLAFSPVEDVLATAALDCDVRTWLLADREHPRPGVKLDKHTDIVRAIAFRPDGRTLASGGLDRSVRQWDFTDPGAPVALAERSGHVGTVLATAFHPSAPVLVTTGGDFTVRLWDVREQRYPRLLKVLTRHTDMVYDARFSPDGRTLATAGFDGVVHLWDTTDPLAPGELGSLRGEGDGVLSLAWGAQGAMLVTGRVDGRLRLWDVRDRRDPQPGALLEGHSGVVFGVAYNEAANLVVSVGGDRMVRVWRATDHTGAAELAVAAGHTDLPYSVAISPQGTLLASSGADHTVRVWDIRDPTRPTEVSRRDDHGNITYSVAFRADGRALVSTGADRTLRLWEVGEGGELTESASLALHRDRVYTAQFSPDGTVVASSGHDGVALLADADPERAAAKVCELPDPELSEAEWQQYFPDVARTPSC
ncbi:WD40 repeat protein/energy-coupling factor transporter ATP-binding protein EcfA2 [Crossiella equi]|uniref:WD40 repeat protein/energy-coupling factor transporter ATP-binding protein EcfA2 n=1 Tax=Crossiella equi TaxID=130796 RepID=A0ABS5AQS5_9PSEU|nr:hypothetical protein [Crossiella equi]MBP2478045.1 WD40 repeat protein/energy-coupling factor transporter ATP-binding protein EcfA2 [Crossiella equi]